MNLRYTGPSSIPLRHRPERPFTVEYVMWIPHWGTAYVMASTHNEAIRKVRAGDCTFEQDNSTTIMGSSGTGPERARVGRIIACRLDPLAADYIEEETK
jgi:hypothetical protein